MTLDSHLEQSLPKTPKHEAQPTCHVFVLVSVALGFAEANTINDGGMVELIRNDSVIRRQENFKQASIGVKAADVENGVLTAMEARNLFLEFFVYILRASK